MTRSERLEEEKAVFTHIDANGKLVPGTNEKLIWRGRPDPNFLTKEEQLLRLLFTFPLAGMPCALIFSLSVMFLPTDFSMKIAFPFICVLFLVLLPFAFSLAKKILVLRDQEEYMVTDLGAYVKKGNRISFRIRLIRWSDDIEVCYRYISEKLISISIYNRKDFGIGRASTIGTSTNNWLGNTDRKESLVRIGGHDAALIFDKISCDDPIIDKLHAEFVQNRTIIP